MCGISVAAGLENIVIKNGTISNFTGAGVCVNGTPGALVTNIKVRSMTIFACEQGITLDYVSNGDIKSSEINGNAETTASTNTHAVKVTNCKNMTIVSCSAFNNTSSSENVYAFYVEASEDCFLEQCSARRNNGSTETAGFYFYNNTQCNIIKNCIAKNNVSTTDDCYGILVRDTCNLFIEGCETVTNVATAGAKTAYGVGLLQGGGTTAQCLIRNNVSDKNEIGFYDDQSSAENNVFISNKAYLNTTANFSRPNSGPIHFSTISPSHLKDGVAVSDFDNISVDIVS